MSIVFFIGYTWLKNATYGSELAMFNLGKHLKNKYKLYIVGLSQAHDVPDFTTITVEEYKKMTFDCIIVWRYVNFWIYLPIRSTKVITWIHDVGILAYFDGGSELPAWGKYLLENGYCNKIVAVSEWHKNFFNEHHDGVKEKMMVIENGINTKEFIRDDIQKIPFRFIWTSAFRRNIDKMLELIPLIRKKYPLTELHIFRDKADSTPKQFELIEEMKEFVIYHGSVPHDEIVIEFLKADIWFYPTNYPETYCISAVEAQISGCLCLSNNEGALVKIIGDRGLIIEENVESSEYNKVCLEKLDELISRREEFSRKAQLWGKEQDWSKRGLEWIKLIESLD